MKKRKYLRFISVLCAAVMMIAAFSVPVSAAKSVAEQMAANSAAWMIAYNAGDTATCDALHAANVALASQAAGSSGSANYDSSSGTWNITTSSGTNISSSSSSNGKNTTATYKSSSGNIASSTTYRDDSINAYISSGGTNSGLSTSYNNAASGVSTSVSYGEDVVKNNLQSEVAVAKTLLGLTDAQAESLSAELETSKNKYDTALIEYNAALASGDTAGAAAALEAMKAAHQAAEATRSAYGYSGDSSEFDDGGYFGTGTGGGSSTGSGSTGSGSDDFYTVDVVRTYNITASAGSGGSISPSGTVAVKQGDSKTFTISASEGYEISGVTVDGSSVGAVSAYTFSNVTAAHSISATFKANGRISISSVTLTDSLGVDLDGTTIKSGYGFFADVDTTSSGVTDVRVVMSYDFGDGNQTVTLQEKSGAAGTYQFPVNAASPTDARCVYIPVATADGTYTLTVTMTAINAAGETLTETATAQITVRGNMYEDDFTGNSGGRR